MIEKKEKGIMKYLFKNSEKWTKHEKKMNTVQVFLHKSNTKMGIFIVHYQKYRYKCVFYNFDILLNIGFIAHSFNLMTYYKYILMIKDFSTVSFNFRVKITLLWRATLREIEWIPS